MRDFFSGLILFDIKMAVGFLCYHAKRNNEQEKCG